MSELARVDCRAVNSESNTSSSDGDLKDYAENILAELRGSDDTDDSGDSDSDSEVMPIYSISFTKPGAALPLLSALEPCNISQSTQLKDEALNKLEEDELGAGPRIEDMLLSGMQAKYPLHAVVTSPMQI